MAVLQMQRISICALKKDRKRILEVLQRRGVIEIDDMVPEDSVFSQADVSSSELLFQKSEQEAKSALEIIDTYKSEDKSLFSAFEGRKVISEEEYDDFSEKYNEVARIINKLLTLGKQIAESKAEVLRLRLQIEALAPWNSLDIPLCFDGTKSTAAFIGILPNAWSVESVYEQLEELMPVNIEIISKSREQTCVFIICKRSDSGPVLDKLKANGFAFPAVSCDAPPMEQKEIYNEKIKELELSINNLIDEITNYAERREDIKLFSDYLSIRIEKYNVIGRLLQSEHVFILTGYIPSIETHKVIELLRVYDAAVNVEDTNEQDDVPILLKNHGFSAPLEGITESFSLPGKGEIDPTFLVSIFYYAFFGLMLSDAMYGFILFLGTTILMFKFPNMERGLKANMKVFKYCGIATMVWGVLFSSYFGDLVDVVSSTFFGKTISIPPLWINMVENPMTILTLSLILGIIHIFTGLAAKAYQCIKQKDFKGVIYDVVFWYVLLIACIVKLVSMQMIMDILAGGAEPLASSKGGTVAAYIIIIAAVGILLTAGRSSKNIGKRLMKGAYALYGITGYLSDVLSYSRLLALGLATGVICSVANMIGTMAGGGVGGAILFIIVFILLNALNISINSLGAYVHTNRLQYVEFFSRFYDGGGRKFKPYSVKTKYYKFKEIK